MEHSRRTVIRAGAWSTPVIAVAAAAPVHAASPTPKLILTTSRAYEVPLNLADGSMQTWYIIRVSSDSTQVVPAGSVVLSAPITNVDYVITGFSGVDWADLSDATTKRSVYNAPIAVGDTSTQFGISVHKNPINRADTPTLTLSVTAAGLESSSIDLPVVYSSVL